jgi:hypothetical protein
MANQQLGFEVVGKSNATEVMGKAGKEADKLANKLKSAFDLKGVLTGAFIGAFGAAALLNKAISTITESFKGMADVADQAGKAGISAAEFSKLSFAAQDAGVSTSVLSKSIRELRFMMKDAQTDAQKMTLLTKGLGYSEEQVRSGQIKSIELFQRVAQAIGTQTTDTGKLAIATAFFGDKVANDMLPVLEAIGKNPDIFKGLLTATEETYKAADELDTKFLKLWHNIKNGVAIATIAIVDQVGKQKDVFSGFFSWLFENSPTGYFAQKMGFKNPFENAPTATGTSAASAQVSKVNADAIIDAQKKTVKNANTIASSSSPSAINGPTSGVIGVGNNATNLIMEEQLDTLKQIKESIDRLGTPGYMNTDFTKQQYPTV